MAPDHEEIDRPRQSHKKLNAITSGKRVFPISHQITRWGRELNSLSSYLRLYLQRDHRSLVGVIYLPLAPVRRGKIIPFLGIGTRGRCKGSPLVQSERQVVLGSSTLISVPFDVLNRREYSSSNSTRPSVCFVVH